MFWELLAELKSQVNQSILKHRNQVPARAGVRDFRSTVAKECGATSQS
ncbi:hypothetical protein [Microcoleus sp. LEGE 07076]